MDTLVLDPGYRPVIRVSWDRAITLLFQGKAEVVEEYDDWTVRSVTLTLKVPSIIRFVGKGLAKIFGRQKGAVKFSRENLYIRDKGRCQYCRTPVKREDLTYDHVVPRSKGGKTTWENIVLACEKCNRKKADKSLAESGFTLKSKPIAPANLPESSYSMTWKPGMPDSWKNFLRSFAYWNGELEHEEA